MIFGVLFSKPDSVQNPFAIFCIFCISTLIKETKLSLKFVCVAKIKFINCKIYLFHNLFVSSNMTAINMNFSPFFYSDNRYDDEQLNKGETTLFPRGRGGEAHQRAARCRRQVTRANAPVGGARITSCFFPGGRGGEAHQRHK